MFSTETLEKYRKLQVPLNWTEEDGYNNPDTDMFPFHCKGGLYAESVFLQLRQLNTNVEYACDQDNGFKILMHSPSDTPLYRMDFLKLSLSHEARISIEPVVMITQSSLKQYSPLK